MSAVVCLIDKEPMFLVSLPFETTSSININDLGIYLLNDKTHIATTKTTYLSQLFVKKMQEFLQHSKKVLTKNMLLEHIIFPFYDHIKEEKIIKEGPVGLDFEAFIVYKNTIFQLSRYFMIIELKSYAAFSHHEMIVHTYYGELKTLGGEAFLVTIHGKMLRRFNDMSRNFAIYHATSKTLNMYRGGAYVRSD